jgi:hypothetical protein
MCVYCEKVLSLKQSLLSPPPPSVNTGIQPTFLSSHLIFLISVWQVEALLMYISYQGAKGRRKQESCVFFCFIRVPCSHSGIYIYIIYI